MTRPAGSYGAVVAVEAARDGWGQTDRGWVSMDYLRPVEAADEGLVTDTGLRIIQDILPAGAKNRPGGSNPDTYITIHETGNFAKGADGRPTQHICGAAPPRRLP